MWKRAAVGLAAALAGAGSLVVPAGDVAAQTITFGGISIGGGSRSNNLTVRRYPGMTTYMRRVDRQRNITVTQPSMDRTRLRSPDGRIRYGGSSEPRKPEKRVNYGASSAPQETAEMRAKREREEALKKIKDGTFGQYTKSATTPVPDPSGTPQGTGNKLKEGGFQGARAENVPPSSGVAHGGGTGASPFSNNITLDKLKDKMLPSSDVPTKIGTPQTGTGPKVSSPPGTGATAAVPDTLIHLSTPVPTAPGNPNDDASSRSVRPKPSSSVSAFGGDAQGGGNIFSRTRGDGAGGGFRDAGLTRDSERGNQGATGGRGEGSRDDATRSARVPSDQGGRTARGDGEARGGTQALRRPDGGGTARSAPMVEGARSPLAPLRTAVAAPPPVAQPALRPVRAPGTVWVHNSSLMQLQSEEERFAFLYDNPRSGLENVGIRSGTLLIEGQRTGAATFAGQATTFSPRQCGPAAFAVAGEANGDGSRVTLRGQKPNRDGNCQVTGYAYETLVFELRQ